MARVIIAVIALIANAALLKVICTTIEKKKKNASFINKIPSILVMLLFILIILLLVICFYYIFRFGFFLYDYIADGEYINAALTLLAVFVADFFIGLTSTYIFSNKK